MTRIELGWDAPSLKQQFPQLSDHDAAHFDLDNDAITRLSIRGYLTATERKAIIKRLGRSVEKELKGGKADV